MVQPAAQVKRLAKSHVGIVRGKLISFFLSGISQCKCKGEVELGLRVGCAARSPVITVLDVEITNTVAVFAWILHGIPS